MTSVTVSGEPFRVRRAYLRQIRFSAAVRKPNPPNEPTSSTASAVPVQPLTITQSLMCGAVARAAQILTMFPVDTIKTRVQVSRIAVAAVRPSPIAQLSSAIQKGNLYRGAAFSLCGNIPYGMLTFGLYETIKTKLFGNSKFSCPEWLQIVIAASTGDAIGSLWLTPSEVVKSKTQAGVFPSPVAAIRAISNQGPLGFYQGYGAAIARDIPFRAIQLSLYERARSWYVKRSRKPAQQITAIENLLMGAICGTLTAATTTPLDVIRTRMMSQGTGGTALYKNAIDCLSKTVSQEGVGALFRGIGPRCFLIGPSSAVFFLAYEASKSFFRSRHQRHYPARVALAPIKRRRARILR